MSKREFKPFLGYVGEGDNIRIILNTFSDGGCLAVASSYQRDGKATQEDLDKFINSDDPYYTAVWHKWEPLPKKKKVPMEWWECVRKVNELRAEMDLTKEEVVFIDDCNSIYPNLAFWEGNIYNSYKYSTINLLTGEIDPNSKKFEKEVEVGRE